jgi:hypothetical protein
MVTLRPSTLGRATPTVAPMIGCTPSALHASVKGMAA